MALTDDERKMLEQLEAQLANEDPSFVQALAPEQSDDGVPGFAVSARHLVIGLIVAVLGLIVVLLGVMIEIVPVGIMGAVIVFAGFWYVAAGGGKKPVTAGAPSGAQQPKGDSFMERQAQAWQRRQEERGI